MTTRGILVAVWFVLIGWSPSAFALDVLVVRPPQEDAALFEAFGRLRAELELQGFQVQVLRGSRDPIDPEALELEARKRGAFAAVSLQRKGGGTIAEIQIVDRVTGKTTTRRLQISRASDGPMLLAIRAADLLRASLLELSPGESPPEDVVGADQGPPPREVVRFSRKLPRFQISAGGVSFWHPDLGFSFGGSINAHVRAGDRVHLGLSFGGPAFGGEFRIEGGTASLRQEFVLASADVNLGSTNPGPRWEWGPVIGLGAVHLAARGEVEPPLVAQASQVWTFGVAGGAFVEAYLSEAISIEFSLSALGQFPQPVVAIEEVRSVPLAIQGLASLRVGVSL